ncbi:MAG: hypothetical protein MI746_15365 [Pseudomonadales bacterium]|nr:hypothetical protein [Pseudomonadales bacterium]
MSMTPVTLPVLCLLASSAMIGCSADPDRQPTRMPTDAEIEQYNASVEREDRIECRREKPLGSRISQRVCRRVGTIEEHSDLTQREWRRTTITNN